ncbi:MAG: hypothetical protein WCC17_10860 [Candidatus Nitrosopolaris sp.]
MVLEHAGSKLGLSMENEVLESKFREKLASIGFKEPSIDVKIKDMMEKDGLERIYTELDGVIYTILRWVPSQEILQSSGPPEIENPLKSTTTTNDNTFSSEQQGDR